MAQKMTYGQHAGALLALGLPLIGSHLAQMALHVSDVVMMGWYGIEELAALVLGSTSYFVLFILGSGFAKAVMPLVAMAAANGHDTEVRRVTRMGIWLSILYSAILTPLFWYSGAIFRALGQDEQVSSLAQDFLRIAGFGMLPSLVVMVLSSYLAALQRTQVLLWVTVAAVFLNAGIGWALIFGNWGAPELGVRGAAIASLSMSMLTMVVLLAYAAWFGPLRRYTLLVRFWRADWQAFGQVWRLGYPIGLTGLFESGMFTAASLMMGWVGTYELAAHGIAMQLASITFMFHVGLSSAATVRTGHALGHADAVGLRDGALVSIGASASFALLTVALFLIFPGQLIGLFLANDDPERMQLIAIGTGLLAMAALFQFADAAQVMALGLLRGVQDTKVPMILASVSYWIIGIPCSYLIGVHLGFGGIGIWLGLVIGLVVAATLLMLRFWRGAARQMAIV